MIELVGFLDSGQKKSALERADCLVFPTFYENEAQPLVLLEAMSAGLPVITTTWRGVPEVLPAEGLRACAIRDTCELCSLLLETVYYAGFEPYREMFLRNFERSRFIASMQSALCSVADNAAA